MVSLTRKYLLHDRTRLAISVSGVSLSILLIFTLAEIYLGFLRQATIFIDNSGADLWVVQKGAHDFYFAISFLPYNLQDSIATVEGVDIVSPFIYQSGTITKEGKSQLVFYFGYNIAKGLGGPWSLVEGSPISGSNQLVIDRTVGAKNGIKVGDLVTLDGNNFTVTGISSGTSGILAPIVFMTVEDAQRVSGWTGFANFFLVKISPGSPPSVVSSSITANLQSVDVRPNQEWAIVSRDAVVAGFTPVMQAMVLMGGVTGFLVIALTNYTGTVERQREYGILKAVGTRNRTLFKVVFNQSIIMALSSFVAGAALSLVAAWVLTFVVQTPLSIVYDLYWTVSILAGSLLIGAAAALLLARKVASVDPAIVFK